MLPNGNVLSTIEEAVRLGVLSSEVQLSRLRKMTPLDLCKEMKSHLCNEETSAAAIHVLAQATIKRDLLHDDDLCVIVNFLCEKATKPKLTGTALNSLRVIVDDLLPSQKCSIALFVTLINSFITKVPLQNLRLTSRRDGFAVISFMINKSTIESCDAGQLHTLLEAMDGEADPILVNDFFQFCKLVLTHAKQEEIQSVAQSYFDSLAAYFPVVFTPPPKCPITKSDLQHALSACLSDRVLVNNSIPFFISKLSSPSMIIRQESIEALETIIQTCPNHVEKKYFFDMVLHTRNEIIKACIYPQYEDNPSTKNFISLSLGLLKSISKKCGGGTARSALEIFAPINEGVISSINSEHSSCSVYATMLYHILTGSLSCSMACGPHLLTMLCAEGEKNDLPNIWLLLSAVCSGLDNAFSTFVHNDDTEAEDIRYRIAPILLERLLDRVRYCGHQITANLVTDEFHASCIVELLASFFSLSAKLAPCIQRSDAEFALNALLHASVLLASPDAASSKASMLICSIVSHETDDLMKMIREELIQKIIFGASTDRVLSLLKEVSRVSLKHALFVINECFFETIPPVNNWQTELTEVQRSDVVLHILDSIDTIGDNMAKDLLKKLTEHEGKSLYYFKCIFSLFTRTPEVFRETIRKDLDRLPLIVAAALVCSYTSASFSNSHAQTKCLIRRFDKFIRSSQNSLGKILAMNGISGVVSTSTLKYDELISFLSELSVDVAVHIAILWGICFRPLSTEDSDSTVTIISSSLGNLLLSANKDEVLDTLSFSPIQFPTAISRESLNILSCYFLIDMDAVVSLRVYWKGVLRLLKVMALEVQPATEANFLARLHQGLRVGVETELLRQALSAFMEKQSPAKLVVKELLLSPTLLAFVLEGLHSQNLVSRCETLNLLSSFSTYAVNSVNEQHNESNLFRKARDVILNTTKLSLSDNKRKVRRAAAYCRHMWHNLN
ncbi:unnamed protein product [Phytomonas sp. Hart1]|nr:unnamed protein product [Phytomonas sp. Hart1]|eukprot:CCW71420.1 unnamed protein product [Phytomonas sp. isolate Hart1]